MSVSVSVSVCVFVSVSVCERETVRARERHREIDSQRERQRERERERERERGPVYRDAWPHKADFTPPSSTRVEVTLAPDPSSWLFKSSTLRLECRTLHPESFPAARPGKAQGFLVQSLNPTSYTPPLHP